MIRFLLVLCGLFLMAPAMAVVLRSGGDLTIPEGEVIDDDLVISGGNIRVLGRVTGDLVIAGGEIIIAGPVGGNVVAAGGNISANGPIGGSAYIACGSLTTTARVARNLVIAAGEVNAGAATRVGRDLAVSAGSVTFAGQVQRNFIVNSGNLAVTDTARVGGDLQGMAGNSTFAAGAVIGGERNLKRGEHGKKGGFITPWWVLWQVLTGLALLLVGLVLLASAPRFVTETNLVLARHPWGSLLAGFLLFIVAPIVLLISMITVIGIPLALVLSAIYLIALYVSPLFLVILAGWAILRKRNSLYPALLLGIALYILIQFVPVLGFAVSFITMLLGLGAMVLALQARTAHPWLREPAPAKANNQAT